MGKSAKPELGGSAKKRGAKKAKAPSAEEKRRESALSPPFEA